MNYSYMIVSGHVQVFSMHLVNHMIDVTGFIDIDAFDLLLLSRMRELCAHVV